MEASGWWHFLFFDFSEWTQTLNFEPGTLMADVHNTATRSYNMSRIKGKNTKPEICYDMWDYKSGAHIDDYTIFW